VLRLARPFPFGPLPRHSLGTAFPFKALACLFAVAGLLALSACSRFIPKRLSESDRRKSMEQFREAIEQAGGTRVWVKTPRSRHPSRPGAATEVLVVRDAYDEVLAAVEEESRRQGLSARVQTSNSPRRSADLRVMSGSELVGHWRLRPVPQLRRAAIVIDDLGHDLAAARDLLRWRYPLTLSVLPRLPYSGEIAEEAHRAGAEVMLHLPMQPGPGSRVGPGAGEIREGMRQEELERTIEQDLASVPHSAGVNNHMGSRATADAALMTAVMKILAEHRLYFVDSRTTASSVALDCARRQGLPAFFRSVFLDDTETVAYTTGQLEKFRRLVEEQGAALAIGHPYPTTLQALAAFAPEFERDDIELVPASKLVHLPEVARLSPASRPRREPERQ
jgi:polysaccharide deacetylase 2 family uncharacterized protein YibQ